MINTGNKNLKILFFIIIFFLLIYLLLNFFIIGNKDLQVIKDKIPLSWKTTVKRVFYQHKIDKFEKIFIKTDGRETFELSNENKIYISTLNFPDKVNLKITGVLKNKNLICYEDNFTKDFIIEINKFKSECLNAIFYIGYTNHYYFYFGLKKPKVDKNKSLLILPASNFFNYDSNVYGINQYTNDTDYIANYNEVPIQTKLNWGILTSSSIHNINNIVKDFDIIPDYKFKSLSLSNYDLIILPLHQEYVSKKFLDKLFKFLELKNKKVLSIGGANFLNEVIFKDSAMVFPKSKRINTLKYNLNTFDYFKNENCFFVDDKNLNLREITEPLVNEKIKYFFYKISCDKNKEIPLLSIQNFTQDGGKLLHLYSDGIGINFSKIKYLKSKIIDELNSIN